MENTVELIGHYGGDIAHCNSAWTSTTRANKAENKDKVKSLLQKLATEGHHTPFEKSLIHFLVTSDVASHIHIIKHRIAVGVNTESSRYKELKDDKFYIPEDWDPVEKGYLESFVQNAFQQYHETIKRLVSKGMNRKRAKESARYYLPYCNQLTQDICFNFRSFMHFQKLRNSPDAQKEIRDIAQKMLECVKNIEGNPFEYSLKAFGY